jgi:hypothetical protein
MVRRCWSQNCIPVINVVSGAGPERASIQEGSAQ